MRGFRCSRAMPKKRDRIKDERLIWERVECIPSFLFCPRVCWSPVGDGSGTDWARAGNETITQQPSFLGRQLRKPMWACAIQNFSRRTASAATLPERLLIRVGEDSIHTREQILESESDS